MALRIHVHSASSQDNYKIMQTILRNHRSRHMRCSVSPQANTGEHECSANHSKAAKSQCGIARPLEIRSLQNIAKIRRRLLFSRQLTTQVNSQQPPCRGQPSPSSLPRARSPRTPSLSPMSSRSVPPSHFDIRDTMQPATRQTDRERSYNECV